MRVEYTQISVWGVMRDCIEASSDDGKRLLRAIETRFGWSIERWSDWSGFTHRGLEHSRAAAETYMRTELELYELQAADATKRVDLLA